MSKATSELESELMLGYFRASVCVVKRAYTCVCYVHMLTCVLKGVFLCERSRG